LTVSQSDLLLLAADGHRVSSPKGPRIARSVREQRFIDLEKGLLIVHEEVKQHAFVAHGEVSQLDSILCQLRKLEKTLFKLAGLLRVLLRIDSLQLLAVDVVLESALHDVLPNLLDAVYKETLELILLCRFVNLVCSSFTSSQSLPIDATSQLLNCFHVVCLESLNILLYLTLNVVRCHLRLKEQLKEFLELSVLSGNESIAARRTAALVSLCACCLAFARLSSCDLGEPALKDTVWGSGNGVLDERPTESFCRQLIRVLCQEHLGHCRLLIRRV